MSDPTDSDYDEDQYIDSLKRLDMTIDEVTRKIDNGRIRDAEKDAARVKYYRALGYLVRTRLKVIEQRDIDERVEELAEKIEEIEQQKSSDYRVK